MWKCTVFGHLVRFHAEGQTMYWICERCGRQAGSKTYESAAQAQRYARAFDRRDTDDLGRRAPLIGMFPLRFWRMLRDRQDRTPR
jgi:hypothetical protein